MEKLSILTILSILLSCQLIAKTYSEKKEIDVSGIEKYAIDVSHVDVTVEEISSDTAVATLEQITASDPDECLMVLNHYTKGKTVFIKTEFRNSSSSRNCHVSRNLSLVLGTKSPNKIELELRHGDLNYPKSQFNAVEIEVAHGETKIDQILAENVELSASHGDLHVKSLQAKSLETEGRHGDLTVSSVRASSFTVDWQHGDLELNNVQSKNLEIENNHGHILLGQFTGDSVEIENGHGKTQVTLNAKNVEVTSRHNLVRINGKVADKTKIHPILPETDLLHPESKYDRDISP